jgi:hypothetical protein
MNEEPSALSVGVKAKRTAVRQRCHSCANVLRPRPQLAARQSWAELIVDRAFKIAGLE